MKIFKDQAPQWRLKMQIKPPNEFPRQYLSNELLCAQNEDCMPKLRPQEVDTPNVDDCSYVRHSPGHKPEREPLRGVCGSYLRQRWNVEMASSLQRVEKNSR
jgi:hypothetical protein